MPPALHYLPPLDPKSDEFTNLFRSFLFSSDERKTILELSEEDARVFIEIIDRVCLLRTSCGAHPLILLESIVPNVRQILKRINGSRIDLPIVPNVRQTME